MTIIYARNRRRLIIHFPLKNRLFQTRNFSGIITCFEMQILRDQKTIIVIYANIICIEVYVLKFPFNQLYTFYDYFK